jgi:trigger factor|tara:strand:+ start:4449 stop:5705 length:1257 start_codon:yes stop_codon:yes gene_type:complete
MEKKMNYKSIEKKDHVSLYEVSLDKVIIENIISDKILKKQETFEVSGFRKGKVPASIIKSKVGPQIENEVLNEEISKNISEITNKEKITSLIQPQLDFKDNFNFNVSFYHKPKINIEGLKETEINTHKVDIVKSDIDDFKDKIRKEYYTLEEEKKVAKESVVDFEITNYSDELKVIFSQKQVRIDLTTKTEEVIFNQIKKILIDCEVKKNIETIINNLKIEIEIVNSYRKIYPGTDKELLKVLKINDIEELNTQINKKLSDDIEFMKKDFYIEEILKTFLEKRDIEIHDDVIDLELKRNYSIDIKDIKEDQKESTESIKKMLVDNIKKDVIYSELVSFFKVVVDQKELQQYLKTYYGEKIDQKTAEMGYATLMRNKIADESMKTFKIKETELSLSEFMKLKTPEQNHNHKHDHGHDHK